ncbi:tigger transposable element-derived protein 1-like [Hermetia illucens]|uniref:tigger transposable element-derived protein 1-like n=1 Tax=Hermetia illucens TaxID=343691 RepID=UPI0018CC3FB4|nr:tigger transposable element-derived protein 1-like [Hermetia illucens]
MVWFFSGVEEYCRKNNLPHKALLLVDNAPGHPATLNQSDENVKVVFLPPNTTSLLQPMDQGVIATFKAYYLCRTFRQLMERLDDIIALDKDSQLSIKEIWKNVDILKAVENIEAPWKEVASGTMNKPWRKICPEGVESPSCIDIVSDSEINREILEIAKTIGFDEIDKEDIFDVINTPEVPLSNEELLNIVTDGTELVQPNLDEGGKESNWSTKKISKFLEHIEKETCTYVYLF